jgi:hypothetical protein
MNAYRAGKAYKMRLEQSDLEAMRGCLSGRINCILNFRTAKIHS